MSIEEIYVKNVYNRIADEFSNTRYRPWSCVEKFLNNVNTNSLIGDIGCGNGKNMNYRNDCIFKGCDFSEKLVNICKNKKLDVIYGNILNIPFENELFDYTLCIAVIHHLSDIDKRKKAIEELLRITKKNGEILILVWSMEQEIDSKRKFIQQDNYITWKDKKRNILCERYYYIFKKNELESLIPNNTIIIQSFYEKGNYGIIIKKI